MLKIISHRGYWKSPIEKNTTIAFKRSFALNFGTETDFRDYQEKLVISHDIPTSNSINATDFFELFKNINPSLTLALNIKSDGLQTLIKNLIDNNHIENYFVFDMSIPDTIGYIKQGMKVFTRVSEHELIPAFYEECAGLWIDCFDGLWYGKAYLEKHLKNGKKIALVSPDLHNRDPLEFWEDLKRWQIFEKGEIILCTDMPEEATRLFS